MIHDVSRKFQQEGTFPESLPKLLGSSPASPESWLFGRNEFIPKVSLPSELFDVGSKCFKQKKKDMTGNPSFPN